jgi:2-oxoisovalerate dehydrogenase E1 component
MGQRLALETGDDLRKVALHDYQLACISREASLLGRKEVLTGKAKFGIFGDGKEVAQLALARQFKPGDFRSGYYRDQTLMMAAGLLSVQEYFAQLYADTDAAREPMTAGRQMNGHFGSATVGPDGEFLNLTKQPNSSIDLSPTASQMPRLLGLAHASKHYRALGKWMKKKGFKTKVFSHGGDEVAFGTIGDASTSEGMFWETMNAAAVLEVPLCMSVWDDGYGISVPKKYQTARESISQALAGMAYGSEPGGLGDGGVALAEGEAELPGGGIVIFKVRAWDYPALLLTYERAVRVCRERHVPVLVHVEECTQPQGHSTSGSHERYKTPERLAWAEEFDCIRQLGRFLMMEGAATEVELEAIRADAKKAVRLEQKAAWQAVRTALDGERDTAVELLRAVAGCEAAADALAKAMDPIRRDVHSTVRQALHATAGSPSDSRTALKRWLEVQQARCAELFGGGLHAGGGQDALAVEPVPAQVDGGEQVDGRIVLRENFKALFERHPQLLTFGEDTGKIGGVNQAMEGMQEAFGEDRVSDTGIRECTIIGQGIGLAMRGLRPIAEIQYLDYLYYALQIMRDDLATIHYRSAGTQRAPLIVRTRGHRLEGIWHAGSPMGAIIHSIRGMHVCVPRNMTEAAGMYNTLMAAGEPALVVECLNGYRSKETLPTNLGEFRVPLGVPEVLREGDDLTIVSYGSTLNLCAVAAERLADLGVEVELVDVRTLLPFDRTGAIAASVAKTHRVLFVDEDVPGGASAYMLERTLSNSDLWVHLDAAPQTLSAAPHLPAYGTDGDYFSKPSVEDIVERAHAMVAEDDPAHYPDLV